MVAVENLMAGDAGMTSHVYAPHEPTCGVWFELVFFGGLNRFEG